MKFLLLTVTALLGETSGDVNKLLYVYGKILLLKINKNQKITLYKGKAR